MNTLIISGFVTKLFEDILFGTPKLLRPVESMPVPFQGRRHGNGLNRHKKPETIQERRFNETLDDEITDETGHRLFVRAKRLNLPNGREDRDRCVQRSWKEHRRTQYK